MLLEGVWKKFGVKNNFSSTPPSNLNYDLSLRHHLSGEGGRKLVPGRRDIRLPELPRASQCYLHFFTKSANRLHEKQNVYSAREKSYPPGRVILLARPTFSTYTLLLAYPRIRGNTVKRRHQSMRTGAFVNSCSGKGKYFFITLAKVDSAREMTLFQDSFPKKKTGLSILSIETRPRP